MQESRSSRILKKQPTVQRCINLVTAAVIDEREGKIDLHCLRDRVKVAAENMSKLKLQ